MISRQKFVLGISLLCLLFEKNNRLAAQTKDTLKEASITGKKIVSGDLKLNEFAPGEYSMQIDSTTLKQYKMQNLSTLLTQQTPVFVKSYSFNGLATLNFRGASAAQSQVYWNGVPIQNAALGVADISTLPVLFLSKVNLVYGGSAALWGSGNVGGALLLEEAKPFFDSGRKALSVSLAAGSYSQYSAGLEAMLSTKKWCFSIKGLGQTALNDFTYTTETGSKQEMPNSTLKSGSILLNTAYKINDYNTIAFSGWYQQYARAIPPALFETYSDKQQKDGSTRMLLTWNRNKNKGSEWYAKASFIKDDIRYDDSSILLHTTNTSYQYYQEIGWRKDFGQPGALLLFMPVQVAWMNQQDSTGTHYQDKTALAASYDIKLLNKRLDLAANARLEQVNTNSFLLPGASASYSLTKWLLLRANAQKTYRTPTLNELYYFPGGNPTLKPEHGWSEDAGYTMHIGNGNFMLSHSLSGFNRDIKDWIIWMGGAIWTPHNIAEVHSRGLETENRLEYHVSSHAVLHFGINTSYVLATTVSSAIANDGSVGKQIPYMPRYNGQINCGIAINRFYVNYNHTYTGYRFTVADESQYLQPYNTGNVQLMYPTKLGKYPLMLNGQLNNIWNEQYTIVSSRPMPGINWLAGVRFTLN